MPALRSRSWSFGPRAFPSRSLGTRSKVVGRASRPPRTGWKLARLLAKLPPVGWPPFEVKELILFQSELSPKVSKYTPLKVIPLG
jgi:hypothetical protein